MTSNTIAILWGSETGNAEGVAEISAGKLKEAGFEAQPMDMAHVSLEQLPMFSRILVVTSTWGDGDPPSNAYDLLGALQTKQIDLSGSAFSVCALGDTSYSEFCKCGKDFDEALANQGAKCLYPMQECDLDYEVPCEQWVQGVIQALHAQQPINA